MPHFLNRRRHSACVALVPPSGLTVITMFFEAAYGGAFSHRLVVGIYQFRLAGPAEQQSR
jgi:hypothetical protein